MRTPDATLDDLISAHGAYLRSITRKGLLAPSGSQASSSTAPDFTAQLHELLKLMLAYKDAVDSLYSYSVAEFTRRQDLAAKIETRTAAGTWGVTEKDENEFGSSHMSNTNKRSSRRTNDRDNESPIPPLLPITSSGNAAADEAAILSSLRQRLHSLATDFRARVNILLGDLAYQPDVDMRFLGVVMNFNDVYAPVRRGGRRRQTNAKEGSHHHERDVNDKVSKEKGKERERVKRMRDESEANGGASKEG
ncbi:hypothetical protein KCU97_g16837, partial [Aureobasidium melanogenum]